MAQYLCLLHVLKLSSLGLHPTRDPFLFGWMHTLVALDYIVNIESIDSLRSHIPLTFPATRKALWCHASIGEPVSLCCPRLSLSVTEQVLYLAYGLSRTSKAANCVLGGAVNVEPDCSEIVIYIDQLEPKNVTETSSGSSSSFWMPTKVSIGWTQAFDL